MKEGNVLVGTKCPEGRNVRGRNVRIPIWTSEIRCTNRISWVSAPIDPICHSCHL